MSEDVGHNAKEQLWSIINRVEGLNEQKKAITSDISDIMTEAKSQGYDVTALRAIIRLRAEDPDKRRSREESIESYRLALGILD